MMPDLSMMQDVRTRVYREVFGHRRDGLQELLEALLSVEPPRSLAQLSLAPGHRRGYGSLYDALNAGRLDVAAARQLVQRVAETLEAAAGGPAVSPPLYALDGSAWPRPDAETSPQRTFCHTATARAGGPPVTPGWDYLWLVQVEPAPTSWVLPQDVRRVLPGITPTAAAVACLHDWLARRDPAARTPIVACDSRYDPLHLSLGLGTLAERVHLCVRLATNRVFWADVLPVARPAGPRTRCRAPRHGPRFALTDPTTHPLPTATWTGCDARGDTITLTAWVGYHARPKNRAAWRTDAGEVPLVSGTLVLVQPTRRARRAHQPLTPLWLWWSGPGPLDLAQVWHAYLRRFAIEHLFRFLKQHLAWTRPHLRQPAAADRWGWLVLLAVVLLRLARDHLTDRRLPWERPAAPPRLSPWRALRAIGVLLAQLGPLAQPPRPAGRSPGRPSGRRSPPAPRWPVVRATA